MCATPVLNMVQKQKWWAEATEDGSKIVRQYESENTYRCHVLLLDKYIQKLPAEAKEKDHFYMKLRVLPLMTYLLLQHSFLKNTLGSMRKTMSSDAALIYLFI